MGGLRHLYPNMAEASLIGHLPTPLLMAGTFVGDSLALEVLLAHKVLA